MQVTSQVLNSFKTIYCKKTKHRARCTVCGKLIEDGSHAFGRQLRTEKYYPVKGLMGFVRWQWFHLDCAEKQSLIID